MKDTNIQWHPGFVAAMNLELLENKNDLIFEKEYNLNTKPLEIDLLIIRKDSSVHISNEIGSFFRGHNMFSIKRWHMQAFINHMGSRLMNEKRMI